MTPDRAGYGRGAGRAGRGHRPRLQDGGTLSARSTVLLSVVISWDARRLRNFVY